MSTSKKLPVMPGYRYLRAGERASKATDEVNYGPDAHSPRWAKVDGLDGREVTEVDAEDGVFRRPANDVPDFAPPAGYRWLKRGETILATDVYVESNGKPVLASDTYVGLHGCIGLPVGSNRFDLGDDGASIFKPFARKLETPQGIDPGEGYRLLSLDETIEQGDEFTVNGGASWILSNSTGLFTGWSAGGWTLQGTAWRRKLPTTPQGIEPGEGYRLLGDDEVIEKGDERARLNYDGDWVVTQFHGDSVRTAREMFGESLTGGPMYFRRKLPATQEPRKAEPGVYAGDGYRFLEVGETIEANDQVFWSDSLFHTAGPIRGEVVQPSDSVRLTYGYYRRNVEATQPAPAPQPKADPEVAASAIASASDGRTVRVNRLTDGTTQIQFTGGEVEPAFSLSREGRAALVGCLTATEE